MAEPERSSSPGARLLPLALGFGAALAGLWFLGRSAGPPPPSQPAPAESRPAPRRAALAAEPEPAGELPERAPTPATPPLSPASEEQPPPPSRPNEGAAKLRPVRGRVIDAATRQPIAGAWVTWRPPSAALVARLLPQAEVGDPGISDAQGYFVLERLPTDLALADTVYAVAPGYGLVARRAVLTPELTLALPAACELEVVLDPPPPPASGGAGPPARVVLEPAGHDPSLRALLARLEPWGSERHRYRIGHLRPGRYRLRVDPEVAGQRVYPLELRAGATTQVRVARAPRGSLAGTFLRLPAPDPDGIAAGLVAVDRETLTRYEVPLASEGSFQIELPQARYALVLLEGRSERLLPGTFEPGGDLQLEPPARRPEHELDLRQGQAPLRSQELGLVRLDEALGDLVALSPSELPGRYSARAAPGRYALFLGTRWIAELELPRSEPRPLSVPATPLRLALALPPELAPEEEVRGRLSLLPEVLLERRPDLAARFREAALPFQVGAGRAELRATLGLPGRYRVVVESDLGRAATTRELGPGLGVLPLALED